MFKEVDTKPNFAALEKEILKKWEEEKTFSKLVAKNRGNKTFSFIDGPITANNPMGVHHAWGRTYKDVCQRHRAMHGYDQRYQNGFDCQGLWVEVEVEKELNLNSKREILDFGLERFARACRERVEKYSLIQTEQSKRLGQWMDWEHSYYTMDDSNIEHIWYFLKKCQQDGLLYQGHRVMPWCLRCGTSLSQHELIDSYKEVVHPSIFIQLPLVDRDKEFFLVWTTTPWTLPANTALAIHPDLEYLLVEKDGRRYWLAEEAKQHVEGGQTLRRVKGKELLGLRYQGPFAELPIQKDVDYRVISWTDVSGEEGTGIVHIAPGCGAEDFQLSKEHDLPVIAPINEAGDYVDGFDFLSGENVINVKEKVIASLTGKDYLFKVEDYKHRYPGCWRCGEDLVFRLEQEWFIRCERVRQPMLDNSGRVKWQPEYAGKLMADWLNNMGDWCISRKRFWGLPLPFYFCECGELTIIGSHTELAEQATTSIDDLPELHRPWIDRIKIRCPHCGKEVKRIEEVGDCWLDAGIVPYSTLQYLQGPEGRKYWEKWFPADFVVEMREQIRLWFYSLLFMSTVLEDIPPYKHVMTYEKVHDETGRPMHKSWGNAIWFDDAVEKMGADVMRYIYTSRNPTVNLNFGFGIADEVKRKILTLWNTYAFFVTYARLDGWLPRSNPMEVPCAKETSLPLLDQWLLARVQETIAEVDKGLFAYDTVRAIRSLDALIEDTSRWYVRRNRRRFWKGEEDEDKNQAYSVLHYTLVTLSRLLAPLLPFLAEELYQNLAVNICSEAPTSVHLCDFPRVNDAWRNKDLVERMEAIMEACRLGHSARNQAGIKVRQPLSRLEIAGGDLAWLTTAGLAIIKDEVNVKEIKKVGEEHSFFNYKVKPEFSRIGSKYGALVPKIKTALATAEADQIIAALRNDKEVTIDLGEEEVTLTADEVVVEKEMAGKLVVAEGEKMVVALDTEIPPELLKEGLARDILRHVQTLRKEGGLQVDTRIILAFKTKGLLADTIKEHADYIARETLANKLELTDSITAPITREIDLAHGKVTIGIRPVK